MHQISDGLVYSSKVPTVCLSDSRMLPSIQAQCAHGKQTSQQATDSSFAAYFESWNLPVPSGLTSSDSSNDVTTSPRTHKQQRVGDELDIDRLREEHQLIWAHLFSVFRLFTMFCLAWLQCLKSWYKWHNCDGSQLPPSRQYHRCTQGY